MLDVIAAGLVRIYQRQGTGTAGEVKRDKEVSACRLTVKVPDFAITSDFRHYYCRGISEYQSINNNRREGLFCDVFMV